jgi:hypothetical protein
LLPKILRFWQKEEKALKLQSPRVDIHRGSFGRRQIVWFSKWFDISVFNEI